MPTTIGNIALRVADLDRSERFYVDVLGLEVTARVQTPDVREVIFGSLLLADGGAPNPDGIWKVFVHTDDSAALYERAVAAGAEAVEPPRHLEQFGVTISFVRDPDGYLLELGQVHPR